MATPQADTYAAPVGTPLARFGAVSVADTVPPTLGGAITVSSVTSTSYTLAWPAATDNLAVTSYERSLDGGASWLDIANVLTLAVTGRTPSSTDQVRVRARDAAGNRSAALSAAVVLLAASMTTYRDTSAMLFQPTPFAQLASRLPLGNPNPVYDFSYDRWGPNNTRVSWHTDWLWTNVGGDWLDAAQVAQGTTAWATVATPTGVPGTLYNHTMNVTAALQFVQTNNRWAAFCLKGTAASRAIATNFHADPTRHPRIDVTYTDATTATLDCTIVAYIGTSTTIPATATASVQLSGGSASNCLIEFQRPTKPVQAATLAFTVTEQQWSGSPTDIRLHGVLNPPTRNAVTPGGAAQGAGVGVLDAGLQADPNAIFVHRYVDGATNADFIAPTFENLNDNDFDPVIWGGAQDLTKQPHRNLGKWTQANLSTYGLNLAVVQSSYAGEGFVPLAPGLGAVRTHVPAHSPAVVDGTVVGQSGAGACQARLLMPIDRIGLQQHLRIRYYTRLHLEAVYSPMTPQNRKHVWQWQDAGARFTDRSGKGGIGPSHDTALGGFSGTSGGNKGWQLRDSWYLCDAAMGGPDETGVAFGWHLYDYLGNNPAGHQYGQNGSPERYGQLGGFGGNIEFDRWYCVEKEIKLNTVGTVSYPAYVADGLLRTWIDGRLVYEKTGMVFRQTPVATDPILVAGGPYITPMRELGIRDVLMNFFYGGQTWPTESITEFFTGVVIADGAMGYIGPMKMPVAGPSWATTAASGTWTTVPMGATLASIEPELNPAINPNYPNPPEWGYNFDRVVTAWCGAAYNEAADEMWLGMGGGHNDYAGNEIMACDFWSDAPAWRIVRKPSGAIGNLLTTNDGLEPSGVYADGRPRAIHGAGKWCYVPGVGPALMLLGGGSWAPERGGKKWSIFIDPATGEAQYTAEAASRVSTNLDNTGTCYDPTRNAIWMSSRNNSVMLRYDIPASGGVHTGTYTGVGAIEPGQGNQNLCYLPGHDCILVGDSTDNDTLSRWRVFDCVTGTWYAPTVNGALVGPIAVGSGQLRWVPALGAACFWDNATQTTLIAKMTPGANPRTDAWTLSTLPVSGGNTVVPTARTPLGTYGRFAYSPRLGGFLLFNSISGPTYFYKL